MQSRSDHVPLINLSIILCKQLHLNLKVKTVLFCTISIVMRSSNFLCSFTYCSVDHSLFSLHHFLVTLRWLLTPHLTLLSVYRFSMMAIKYQLLLSLVFIGVISAVASEQSDNEDLDRVVSPYHKCVMACYLCFVVCCTSQPISYNSLIISFTVRLLLSSHYFLYSPLITGLYFYCPSLLLPLLPSPSLTLSPPHLSPLSLISSPLLSQFTSESYSDISRILRWLCWTVQTTTAFQVKD